MSYIREVGFDPAGMSAAPIDYARLSASLTPSCSGPACRLLLPSTYHVLGGVKLTAPSCHSVCSSNSSFIKLIARRNVGESVKTWHHIQNEVDPLKVAIFH